MWQYAVVVIIEVAVIVTVVKNVIAPFFVVVIVGIVEVVVDITSNVLVGAEVLVVVIVFVNFAIAPVIIVVAALLGIEV